MKTKISNKIPKLKKKCEDFNEKISHNKFLDVKSNIYDTLIEIDSLEKTCNHLVEKSKKVQDF